MYRSIIDAADLLPHVGDADWIIVDCRYTLADVDAGIRAYETGHIPTATYAHLDHDRAIVAALEHTLDTAQSHDSCRRRLVDPDRSTDDLSLADEHWVARHRSARVEFAGDLVASRTADTNRARDAVDAKRLDDIGVSSAEVPVPLPVEQAQALDCSALARVVEYQRGPIANGGMNNGQLVQ